MKGKNLLAGLLMAFLGAVIALVVYTQFVGTPVPASQETSGVDSGKAQAYLTSLQQRPGQIDFTYAAEQTVHAVVHVTTKTMMGAQASNPIMEFFYGREYQQQQRPREVRGYGSGVIISSDGYIITNNHVIEDAENVEIALNDRRTYNAEVVGRDPSTDLALLKVKAENLPFVKYGDSDKLKVGEWVLAVGNPFNLTSTVTAGIVSAKGRSLGLTGDYQIESFIQTDAALNMGNSGGALVDSNGNLVGITSAIYSPSGAYSGNSFAIPVTIVSKVIGDLMEFGTVQRALIGVNIKDVSYQDAEEQKLAAVRGILVTNVVENGAAEAAGMKQNDVIIEFDGVPVNSVGELQEQVGKHRPGDKATVKFIRNGKENNLALVLKNADGNTNVITREAADGDIVFGARLQPLNSADQKRYKVNYGVKVVDPGKGKFAGLDVPKGFIILSVNGKRVESPADVRRYSSNEKELRNIEGLSPDGSRLIIQFGN
jgi:serine protease Do